MKKELKKKLAYLLCLILGLQCISNGVGNIKKNVSAREVIDYKSELSDAITMTEYANGNRTSKTVKISNRKDLEKFFLYLDENGDKIEDDTVFMQTADILINGLGTPTEAEIKEYADLEDTSWESAKVSVPKSNHGEEFRATYDGGGHVIKGAWFESESDCQSVFGLVSGTVKNLRLKNCMMITEEGKFEGFLAGGNYGLIENCHIENCVIGSSGRIVEYGWIAGSMDDPGKILICSVENSKRFIEDSAYVPAGGICGIVFGGKIVDCQFYIDFSAGYSFNAGLISKIECESDRQVLVSNCNSYIKNGVGVESGYDIGGLIGEVNCSAGGTVIIEKCENLSPTFSIPQGGLFAHNFGGIVGNVTGDGVVLIQDCINHANIEHADYGGHSYWGGIVGYLKNGLVSGCKNYGSYLSNNSWACACDRSEHCTYFGGLIGRAKKVSDIMVQNSDNYGNLRCTGADFILGYKTESSLSTIKNCQNYGEKLEFVVETAPTPPIATYPPSATPTPIPSDISEADETSVELETDDDEMEDADLDLDIKGVVATITKSGIQLSWRKNKDVTEIDILRSTKLKDGYKTIKRISSGKTSFLDKSVRSGKEYYYVIQGYGNDECGKEGHCKIRVPYKEPTIHLSKGKLSQGRKYIGISLKKYQASYVEVYISVRGGRYEKVNLKSDKISYYKGKIKMSYSRAFGVVRCKVRTYDKKKGKKLYSWYSEEKEIKL